MLASAYVPIMRLERETSGMQVSLCQATISIVMLLHPPQYRGYF